MRNVDLVSVVIPAYNAARYLPETLRSILSQTHRNLEVLVIDDGSTDETAAVVSALRSERVRYIYQDPSGSPAAPRNRGIREARGTYVSLFDADDIMLPHKIENQVRFLKEHSGLGLVFTDFIEFDDETKVYARAFLDGYPKFAAARKTPAGPNALRIEMHDAYKTLFDENYIGT